MNKKMFGFLVLVIVATLVLSIVALPALANNNRPKKADGVWCYTPGDLNAYEFVPQDSAVPPFPAVPEQDFLLATELSWWTGALKGDATEILWGVGYDFPPPDFYPTAFGGVVTFEEVKVKGRTGGLELDVGGYKAFGLTDWVGAWQVRPGSATGELEGLEGYGTLRGPGFQPTNPTECGEIYYFVKKLKFTKAGD